MAVILIDSDEVCFPFSKIILEVLSREFSGIEIPILTKWYTEDNFKDKKIKKRIREIISYKGFFATLDIVDGAKKAIQNMIDVEHDPHICTCPASFNQWSFEDKMTWWKYMFGMQFVKKRVIIGDDKTMFNGDILIDDNPKIIKGIFKPTWEQIVFDRPWNQHLTMLRRLDWTNFDYMGIIEDILYKKTLKEISN